MEASRAAEAVEDGRLLARMEAGDAAALADLYDRHAGVLFSLAVSICRDERDAEEAVADTFHQAWRRSGEFDSARGTVLAWLVTMTRSRALDRRRAGVRRATMRDRAEAAGVDATADSRPLLPDEAAEQGEVRERVQGALTMLSEIQREAIEMAYFGGLSQSQISTTLEVPLGTVKTRIRDGMSSLRSLLGRSPEGTVG